MHDLEVQIFFIKLIKMGFIVIFWGLFHKKAWKGREKAAKRSGRCGVGIPPESAVTALTLSGK